MSDHAPDLPDTGAVANAPDSDEEYFAMLAGNKPKKPAAVSREITPEVITEIEECLQAKPAVGSTYEARVVSARSDRAQCPFCRYETWDRFLLQEHVKEHDEVKQFRQSVYRKARKFDGLHERRRQLQDSAERLKVEMHAVNVHLDAFDQQGLREQQRQLSRLTRILYT